MNSSDRSLDSFKREYLSPTPDREVDQAVLELVSDYVISRLAGGSLLELGVGDQVWTPKLMKKAEKVTSVDGSQELLEAMRQKLTEKQWVPVLSYFEEYKPEERFDTVLITYVLEHVDDPFLILQLARRHWVREGGRLAVVVPHALSLHRRLAVKMNIASYCGELGDTDRRMGHKRCLTCFEMERMIVDAGFRIVEQKGMFTKAFPNSMLTQCTDEQLRGLFELGLELPIEYSAAIFFLAEPRSA